MKNLGLGGEFVLVLCVGYRARAYQENISYRFYMGPRRCIGSKRGKLSDFIGLA